MNSNTYCIGCFPEFQENQLAHTGDCGCLYFSEICDFLLESESISEIDNNIEFEKVFETEKNECCICYEFIDKDKNNCTTECGHTFCFKCLATSLIHNNSTCPCCRAKLVDIPVNDEEDLGDDDTEDEYDDDDDDDIVCDIDEIISRIDKNGFTKDDIISMLIGRYKKDEKYTNEYIYDINNKFNLLIEDADNEAKEQKLFELEDFRIVV
uniref:RING-type domain-containing protein n=1 Tax=viral metagenome TaxID=1070528 RepID=A0A6C0HU33_9ZZZZ